MEAPSSRQSRMAIDSLLNPSADRHSDMSYSRLPYASSSSSSSLSSHCYPPSPNRYSYSQYYPDPGYHHQLRYPSYSEGSRASFSSSSMIPPSAESSPGPYSRDRYDSVSSSSSITTPTTTATSSSARTSTGSATTPTSSSTDRRRPPRPKYEEEEMYFIWYHRVDLCQEWREVRECFNRQFPNRQRSGFQGIQCKFYRFIRDKKCPTLREQRRMRDGEFVSEGGGTPPSSSSYNNSNNNHPIVSEIGPPKFGVIEWMGVWYPWMRENRDQVSMMARRIST